MAQHIWHELLHIRICEDCHVQQFNSTGTWQPEVYPICPGDGDDDDGRHGRRKPRAPSGAPPTRVLELA